jgi:hypothetical protein
MELEGFGTSLVGRCVYVHSGIEESWIPWEFLGANYTGKILITTQNGVRSSIGLLNEWNAVFCPRPESRDWSAIATVLKGYGSTILLVFTHDIAPPASFLNYLDGLLMDGRTVISRVWLSSNGTPVVPDAVLFPIGCAAVHEISSKLPAVRNHGAWRMTEAECRELTEIVYANKYGIMISDVGESAWTLFWHRQEDSRINSVGTRKLLGSLLRCAAQIAEA